MQLGRFQVSTLRPPPILSIHFSQDGRLFTIAGETGYEIWRTFPLALVKRKALPGTLARVLPLPNSPLLVLQGGGSSPLYPPNKAIIYHDAIGAAIAELEFGERIRGIAVRQATICVALSRKTLAFEIDTGSPSSAQSSAKGKEKAESSQKAGLSLRKVGEWETALNETGLIALATSPGSTLLALLGRQPGHVQLIHLPPCRSPSSKFSGGGPSKSTHPPPAFRSPIILAHTHHLSGLTCTANGEYICTASERGTLLRVWDTNRGRMERELRRGVDPVEMWGVAFEDTVFGSAPGSVGSSSTPSSSETRSGGRVIGWSDKGTVHVWASQGESSTTTTKSSTGNTTLTPSLTNLISRNLPLPKYFSSEASFAQYHLPRKNPHAFASTISAAASAARVPSMRISESGGMGEHELSERFVVGWIEVEVEMEVSEGDRKAQTLSPASGSAAGGVSQTPLNIGMGMGMGTREERRSFGSGSDNTSSRTATPTLANTTARANTPTTGYGYGIPNLSKPLHIRTSSGGSKRSEREKDRKVKIPVQEKKVKMKLERQLVAISYSGDWYRLRIPDRISGNGSTGEEDEEMKRSGNKCELVEYRRLIVGGGGW